MFVRGKQEVLPSDFDEKEGFFRFDRKALLDRQEARGRRRLDPKARGQEAHREVDKRDKGSQEKEEDEELDPEGGLGERKAGGGLGSRDRLAFFRTSEEIAPCRKKKGGWVRRARGRQEGGRGRRGGWL